MHLANLHYQSRQEHLRNIEHWNKARELMGFMLPDLRFSGTARPPLPGVKRRRKLAKIARKSRRYNLRRS